MKKKIVITGGSGFIGKALCRDLIEHGYDIIVLSRNPTRLKPVVDRNILVAPWDGKTTRGWLHHASGAHALVNLAGENIASSLRWTEKKKERLLSSRLAAGMAVAEAVDLAEEKPRVVIQASAIGYYGSRDDTVLEESSPPGRGFLAQTAQQWEAATRQTASRGVRHAVVRTGIVLGRGRGFLSRVTVPFRFFLGGHPGSGRQWVSWIHIDDEAAAIRYLIDHDGLSGPFNLTAPHPLTAREFFRTLGRVMNRPSWCHVPAWVLRVALGELAEELLLSGQRVLPGRLLASGFQFRYPDALGALEETSGSKNRP